jgi:hypothetical protein
LNRYVTDCVACDKFFCECKDEFIFLLLPNFMKEILKKHFGYVNMLH